MLLLLAFAQRFLTRPWAHVHPVSSEPLRITTVY